MIPPSSQNRLRAALGASRAQAQSSAQGELPPRSPRRPTACAPRLEVPLCKAEVVTPGHHAPPSASSAWISTGRQCGENQIRSLAELHAELLPFHATHLQVGGIA